MNILIINDDGINVLGIILLVKEVFKEYNVIIVVFRE